MCNYKGGPPVVRSDHAVIAEMLDLLLLLGAVTLTRGRLGTSVSSLIVEGATWV